MQMMSVGYLAHVRAGTMAYVMQNNKVNDSYGRGVFTMWAQYEWLIWVLFGGLFLFLMFRGGGCCAGHGSHGGHGGRGSNDHEEHDDKTEAAKSQNRSRTGCH